MFSDVPSQAAILMRVAFGHEWFIGQQSLKESSTEL